MSSASDTPRYPASPGGPERPAMPPPRRGRALSAGDPSADADGGPAGNGAGGPSGGYQVPGVMAETPAPSADSWFTPRGATQGPGQQPQWAGQQEPPAQEPSRGG